MYNPAEDDGTYIDYIIKPHILRLVADKIEELELKTIESYTEYFTDSKPTEPKPGNKKEYDLVFRKKLIVKVVED